jgi:predicted nucleic acid-binding protein
VHDLPKIRVVPHDPKDDMVVATAVAAGADYLVTGDRRHLLSLREYEGIRIVTPRQFLDFIARDD